jgi:hypothetical protein
MGFVFKFNGICYQPLLILNVNIYLGLFLSLRLLVVFENYYISLSHKLPTKVLDVPTGRQRVSELIETSFHCSKHGGLYTLQAQERPTINFPLIVRIATNVMASALL